MQLLHWHLAKKPKLTVQINTKRIVDYLTIKLCGMRTDLTTDLYQNPRRPILLSAMFTEASTTSYHSRHLS